MSDTPAPTKPLPEDSDPASLEPDVYLDAAGNVTICPPSAVATVSAPTPGSED